MPILNEGRAAHDLPGRAPARADQEGAGEPTGEPDMYRPTGNAQLLPRRARPTTSRARSAAEFAKTIGRSRRSTSSTTRSCTGRGSPSLFKRSGEELGHQGPRQHESIDYKQSDFRTLMAQIKDD